MSQKHFIREKDALYPIGAGSLTLRDMSWREFSSDDVRAWDLTKKKPWVRWILIGFTSVSIISVGIYKMMHP